jgi:hypothetical protein
MAEVEALESAGLCTVEMAQPPGTAQNSRFESMEAMVAEGMVIDSKPAAP